MYYRTQFKYNVESKLGLYNYLVNEKLLKSEFLTENNNQTIEDDSKYNFNEVIDYYDNRDEFEYVGIIDKEYNQKKNIDDIKDVFKIREKRAKILEKKRGTGIPSLKGAVCGTSKQKEYLEAIAKYIGLSISKDLTRNDLCNIIMNKLIELEKYSKGNAKKTYIMIPINHPKYKFPLNIEDRVIYVKEYVNNLLIKNINFNEKVEKFKTTIKFKLTEIPSKTEITKLEKIGFVSKDHVNWNIIID